MSGVGVVFGACLLGVVFGGCFVCVVGVLVVVGLVSATRAVRVVVVAGVSEVRVCVCVCGGCECGGCECGGCEFGGCERWYVLFCGEFGGCVGCRVSMV